MTIRNLLNIKINLVGAIVLSIIASASTIVLSNAIDPLFGTRASPQTNTLAVTTPDVISCDSGVYSPVQRSCVSKEVFDAEMQRLFAALGIDTSVYGLGNSKN